MTWNELLAALDTYLEELGSSGEITPDDCESRATDLADRAEMLTHAAWRIRRDRGEIGVQW